MKKDPLRIAADEGWSGSRRGHGGPFGAVIVKNGRFIARSHNTVLRDGDPTCHAEINAIRAAVRKLKTPFLTGCTVYSTTEPCPMCFSALHWARVKKVVYSTVIADVKKLGFNELTISNSELKRKGKSRLKLERIFNKECLDLLSKWKKLPRKRTY